MVNRISLNAEKAGKVLREEGLISLLRKIKKTTRYSLSESHELSARTLRNTELMPPAGNMAERWLVEHRNRFSMPFFILLKFLMSMNEQLNDATPLAGRDYENYFRDRFILGDFPFEVPFRPVKEHEDIMQFIHEFDYANLDKMVRSVFIGLIGFLTRKKGEINLLDFGTGPTCGMYGENGRFLFEQGNVDIDNVFFFGIDDLHKPHGSIFKNTTYRQGNILTFTPGIRFDLITGHHVLEHCYNWEEVLLHISSLLKPDGYLYLSFPRFGGFYDTAYRLMSPSDHCSGFDIHLLKNTAKSIGLEICLSDIYVDPNNRFNWLCNLYPELINKEMADHFYDLCVRIDSRSPLGFHHYGYYMVMRKTV